MAYQGPERRCRFVYKTRNTEYHISHSVCVAVRKRDSQQWCRVHPALEQQLEGGVRIYDNGAVLPSMKPPEVGEPMFFSLGKRSSDQQLVTSRVDSIGRPDSQDLSTYPHRA